MAMAMDIFMEDAAELDFSGYSTTTTTTTTTTTFEDDNACNWNDWSPLVDWDSLSGAHDDFHHLFHSILDDDDDRSGGGDAISHSSNSNSNSSAVLPNPQVITESSGGGDDLKGLRLVHLLMAAAEALTGSSTSRDLARVILVRLKELVSPSHHSNMERLAAYFTDALQNLLDGVGGGGGGKNHHHYHREDHHHQTEDVLAAFQLLQDMSPYVKFGHFTANQAILEGVAHSRRVHIVDYDIMEGIQWASLMQALVCRKEGPPAPHLRITALSRGSGGARRSIGTIQETGRRLAAFAASIGQPFSFHQCRLDPDEAFRPAAVKVVKGETLVVNCMLHLPHFTHRSPASVGSFLRGAKTLNPAVVTLVEEEVGAVGEGGFVGRFMDSLHHYSAVYDSLEAGFPMQGRARALVERVFLGPRISGSLARIYRTREEEEEGGSWGEWLGAEGFRGLGISFANHCQSKLLLGLFNDGYRVEELAKNRLVLGWKSCRLLSASIWTSPHHSISDTTTTTTTDHL